jgi:hypothetical protein
MYRRILTRFFPPAALIILICACAKIGAPSGGPRDRLPPEVINSVPELGAVNFMGNRLTITFNEYVVLDNVNEKFMVSPPMKSKPTIYIRGKNINVDFEEELKDSTTYTFYFQDAIKDLNEGNILYNYQFVFSTGPVIDSLSVTGNVYNSFNLDPPEKTLVLMYNNQADSAVVKNLPDYISGVDQYGYFRINNVRPGTYRLYALTDIDNSKNYNIIDEEFAFMNSPVEVTPEENFIPEMADTTAAMVALDTIAALPDSKGIPEPVVETGQYQLFLFKALRNEYYLTSSSRDLKYHLIYTLSLPPGNMDFDFSIPGAGNDAYFIERSINRDTLKIWLTDSTIYSQQQITTVVKYPFTDTLKTVGYKEDTILMRFMEPRPLRGVVARKPKFNMDINIRSGSAKPGQKIVFKSQTPFRQPDTSLIHLYEMEDVKRINIPYTIIKDSINSCRYILNSIILPGKKYLFIADSASFGNMYNEASDSIGIKFSVRDLELYSKLTMNISNYEGSRIIQLLNNSEKVLSEVYMEKDGDVAFPLLENGFYRVRVIYDLDGDGKWTTGDFFTGRQPEPVSYYNQEMDIKIGWEYEQPWDISIKNTKDQKLRAKKKAR